MLKKSTILMFCCQGVLYVVLHMGCLPSEDKATESSSEKTPSEEWETWASLQQPPLSYLLDASTSEAWITK